MIIELPTSIDVKEILLPYSNVYKTTRYDNLGKIMYYIHAPEEEMYKYIEWFDESGTGLFVITESIAPESQSTIEASPKKYNIGDIDFNGVIDVTDLTELSLALLGDRDFTVKQRKVADIDGDDTVTIADLARLQQYLSKKITSF